MTKKPIYKRVWFWIIVVVVLGCVGAAVGGGSDDSDKTATTSQTTEKKEEKKIEYTETSVEQMLADLEKNAAAASDQYKDKYVSVTGRLSNIDSSGDYIDIAVLNENDWEHMFSTVQCYIKNDDQLNAIKAMAVGDTVVVKGKITDVGEVLGYSIDIDSIEKQ